MEQGSISQYKLDEKTKQLREELTLNISKLDRQIQSLDQKLTISLSRLQKETESSNNSSPPVSAKPQVSEPIKPKPQVNIDSSDPGSIKQKPLTN